MSKRQKIAIVIAIILLLLLLGVMALMSRGQGPAVFINTGTGDSFVNRAPNSFLNTTSSRNIPSPTNEEPEPEPEPEPVPEPDIRSSILRLAASFSERFGSFSNVSRYENIIDLKAFMTSEMEEWADNYVAEQLEEGVSGVYSGVTTRAINSQMVEFHEDRGEATVLVKTQRTARGGGSLDENVYYQDIVLEFKRIGDAWKVDSALWDEGS